MGKRASRMKLQTNKALSYYTNNFTALKTQRQTRERERACSATAWKITTYAKQYVARDSSYTDALNSVREINFKSLKFFSAGDSTQRVNFRFSQQS